MFSQLGGEGRPIHQHLADAPRPPVAQEGTVCSHSICRTAVPGKLHCPWVPAAAGSTGGNSFCRSKAAGNDPCNVTGTHNQQQLQQMLVMQSAGLEILNRLGKLLPEVKQFGILLVPRLDHLILINPSNLSLINLGSLQPSAERSFPSRQVEQAWGCREENLPCDH